MPIYIRKLEKSDGGGNCMDAMVHRGIEVTNSLFTRGKKCGMGTMEHLR